MYLFMRSNTYGSSLLTYSQALLNPGDTSGGTFGKTLVGVGDDLTLTTAIASARRGANVLLAKPSL